MSPAIGDLMVYLAPLSNQFLPHFPPNFAEKEFGGVLGTLYSYLYVVQFNEIGKKKSFLLVAENQERMIRFVVLSLIYFHIDDK